MPTRRVPSPPPFRARPRTYPPMHPARQKVRRIRNRGMRYPSLSWVKILFVQRRLAGLQAVQPRPDRGYSYAGHLARIEVQQRIVPPRILVRQLVNLAVVVVRPRAAKAV